MVESDTGPYVRLDAVLAAFPRLAVGAELKRAMLKRRELEKLNAGDGKLKQGGAS